MKANFYVAQQQNVLRTHRLASDARAPVERAHKTLVAQIFAARAAQHAQGWRERPVQAHRRARRARDGCGAQLFAHDAGRVKTVDELHHSGQLRHQACQVRALVVFLHGFQRVQQTHRVGVHVGLAARHGQVARVLFAFQLQGELVAVGKELAARRKRNPLEPQAEKQVARREGRQRLFDACQNDCGRTLNVNEVLNVERGKLPHNRELHALQGRPGVVVQVQAAGRVGRFADKLVFQEGGFGQGRWHAEPRHELGEQKKLLAVLGALCLLAQGV